MSRLQDIPVQKESSESDGIVQLAKQCSKMHGLLTELRVTVKLIANA